MTRTFIAVSIEEELPPFREPVVVLRERHLINQPPKSEAEEYLFKLRFSEFGLQMRHDKNDKLHLDSDDNYRLDENGFIITHQKITHWLKEVPSV